MFFREVHGKNVAGKNDRQGKKVTGQQAFLAGHCPLTGRYFEPWFIKNRHWIRSGRWYTVSLNVKSVQINSGLDCFYAIKIVLIRVLVTTSQTAKCF